MAQPDRGPRVPAPLDEEIIAAQEQGVLSTLTDGARIARIRGELKLGFSKLAHVGPAASFFGSARTSSHDPEYALARGAPRDHACNSILGADRDPSPRPGPTTVPSLSRISRDLLGPTTPPIPPGRLPNT